jgi:23S rRNA pseudouridine2605 synthase/16S rRNA pseudouridine516 synthase
MDKSLDRTPVRLQKLLAEAGVASRRACEALIESGRVEVNGKIVTKLGTHADPITDKIRVDGVRLSLQDKAVYIFNKPKKVISSMSDPEGRPCIGDYVKNFHLRLFPVGRLDYDVCGLILLTNDGELSQKLLHPKYEVKRRYIARVKGLIVEKKVSLLLRGISLPDGYAKASEVKVLSRDDGRFVKYVGPLKDDESLVSLSVKEGRNHFVKRILEAVGHPVRGLMRDEFGPYTLGNLRAGDIRQVGITGGLLE